MQSGSVAGNFMTHILSKTCGRRGGRSCTGKPAPGTAVTSGRSAGFTLLELIMVIVVIGLAIAISFPALSRGTATIHLRSAGRDVLNVLRYAREKAITGQREMRFVAEKQGSQVMLTDELGETGKPYALPHGVIIDSIFAGNEEIREGSLVVRFLPNGSSTPATIVLKSDAGGYLRIVTDPITGGARIVTGQQGSRS